MTMNQPENEESYLESERAPKVQPDERFNREERAIGGDNCFCCRPLRELRRVPGPEFLKYAGWPLAEELTE